MKWDSHAGGIGAADGKHGSTCTIPGFGEYTIQPVSWQNGRHKGYMVYFVNKFGSLPRWGLWQLITSDGAMVCPGKASLGLAHSVNEAKQRCKRHYEKWKRVKAMYVSVWDDRIELESPCVFDVATQTVTDIEPTADDVNADCRTDEYVRLDNGSELRESDGITFDY